MPRKKIDKLDSWNIGGKPWKKFLDKVASFKDLPLQDWSEYQMLGYALNSIKENLGVDIVLSYGGNDVDNNDRKYFHVVKGKEVEKSVSKNEPNKNVQVLIMRKIISILQKPAGSNAKTSTLMPCKEDWNRSKVKSYIDWSIKKAAKKNVKIFTMSYLFHLAHAKNGSTSYPEIDAFLIQAGKIDRSEELPETIKVLIPVLKTFGELSFYCQTGAASQETLDEIKRLGVDLSKIV